MVVGNAVHSTRVDDESVGIDGSLSAFTLFIEIGKADGTRAALAAGEERKGALAALVETNLREPKGDRRTGLDARPRAAARAIDELLGDLIDRGADRPADACAERAQRDQTEELAAAKDRVV